MHMYACIYLLCMDGGKTLVMFLIDLGLVGLIDL